jgi:hypothetical protein
LDRADQRAERRPGADEPRPGRPPREARRPSLDLPPGEQLPAAVPQGNSLNPLYLGAAGNLPGWLALFYELGVDGLFTDNPDTGVAVLENVFENGREDDGD